MAQKATTATDATPARVRDKATKRLEKLRPRLTALLEARPALLFDADAGIEAAIADLATNQEETAALEREIADLEGLIAETVRREAAANATRRNDLIELLTAKLKDLDAASQLAKKKAAFAFNAWTEQALAAAVVTSEAFSLADDLRGLTGDHRYARVYHAQFLDILREDQAQRFRTMLTHEVRDARSGVTPDWKPLVLEARALTPTKGQR